MKLRFNKTTIAKRVVSTVVGVGTTLIINGIIENNTDPEKATDKVALKASGFVLGAMVADMTKEYTDAKIDDMIDGYKGLTQELKENKEN